MSCSLWCVWFRPPLRPHTLWPRRLGLGLKNIFEPRPRSIWPRPRPWPDFSGLRPRLELRGLGLQCMHHYLDYHGSHCGVETHHHHRQPWAQRPLVSDAILTIAAHRCLSRAAWLNSCRVVPHHCSMSSDHFRWGRPLLFEPSIIPNTRVFIFLLSFILQIWPKRRNFLCILNILGPESLCKILSRSNQNCGRRSVYRWTDRMTEVIL